jgi:hypothetical protein
MKMNDWIICNEDNSTFWQNAVEKKNYQILSMVAGIDQVS